MGGKNESPATSIWVNLSARSGSICLTLSISARISSSECPAFLALDKISSARSSSVLLTPGGSSSPDIFDFANLAPAPNPLPTPIIIGVNAAEPTPVVSASGPALSLNSSIEPDVPAVYKRLSPIPTGTDFTVSFPIFFTVSPALGFSIFPRKGILFIILYPAFATI